MPCLSRILESPVVLDVRCPGMSPGTGLGGVCCLTASGQSRTSWAAQSAEVMASAAQLASYSSRRSSQSWQPRQWWAMLP